MVVVGFSFVMLGIISLVSPLRNTFLDVHEIFFFRVIDKVVHTLSEGEGVSLVETGSSVFSI